MYRIDKGKNRIEKLEKRTFSELGFRERDHLQEWIANDPSSFDEELLIIQKEFSGFNDTHERLDLLALDKNGSLVVIENKLDDSGKDVTWQAMKYASYCSGLSKENIREIFQDYLDKQGGQERAEENLSDFFGGKEYEEIQLNKGLSQRIILVAAKFRKEVTSTVLWLMNFKLRVQCFRVTPYSMGDQLFLNFEQIIPTKDTEDYMIVMADKVQDEIENQTAQKHRHIVRREFWSELIKAMNQSESSLYQNISPSINHWVGAGSGVRGAPLNFVVSKTYARVELYIDRGKGNEEENNVVFDFLKDRREKIEEDFGESLEWENKEGVRYRRIKAETAGNIFDRDQWSQMIAFMVDAMVRLEKAVKPHLSQVNNELKGYG